MLRSSLLAGLASLVLLPASFAGIISNASQTVTSNFTASYETMFPYSSGSASGACGSGVPSWLVFSCSATNSSATSLFSNGSSMPSGATLTEHGSIVYTFTGDLFIANGSSSNVAFDMSFFEEVMSHGGETSSPVLTVGGAAVPITSTQLSYTGFPDGGHRGTWSWTANTNIATGVYVPYSLTYTVSTSLSNAWTSPQPFYQTQFSINGINGEPVPSATPEPGSMAAMASGLVALTGFGLRRRARR